MSDPFSLEDDGVETARPRWPRLFAGRLALIYIVVAGGWILGTDWLLGLTVPQAADITWLQTAKGIAFVVITGGLLYALLSRARRVQDSIEATLVRNEDRFRRLAEQAPDIIYRYRLHPEPGFEYISPAVTAVTGYTPADHYADPQLGMKLVYPDQRPVLAGLLSGDLGGEPLALRWVHRDGRVIWTEQHNVAIRDEAGRVVAIEGVARDVTEREQSAAQLRLLETALQVAASAVVIADRDGVIQWANSAFTALTGYSADEAMGGTSRLLSSGLHGPAFYRELWDTITRGQVWRGELVNRRKDGSLYHEEQSITPVRGAGGAITHFIAIKQDVTERVLRDRERYALAVLTAALRKTLNRADLPPALLEQLPGLVRAESIALATRDLATGATVFEAGSGIWAQAAGLRLPPGAGITGQVIAAGASLVGYGPSWEPDAAGGPLPDPAHAAACVPLRAQDEIVGAIWAHYPSPPDQGELHLLEVIADIAGSAINRATLHEGLQRANDELARAYDSTLEGWARALELRDRETEGHSRRVTDLTERIARALGLSGEQLVHIRRGALLHDIGKMGVPDAILHKPGPLSAEEWAQMREHPWLSYKLLSPIEYLRPALEIPYCHHERWDGSGYPQGLAGEAIPLAARIFAVADVWDALTTPRPYKAAWGPEEARAYLRAEAGRLFDPLVVAALFGVLEQWDG
jgi:PAS domain S-box-containing protein